MNSWWVDTDPGVDDAWALLMLLRSDAVRIEGISVVGGNVGLQHTLRNACRIVDRAPYPVPVHAGAAQPLIGGLPDAGFVHGDDGFGDADLPPAATTPQSMPAVHALIEASMRAIAVCAGVGGAAGADPVVELQPTKIAKARAARQGFGIR